MPAVQADRASHDQPIDFYIANAADTVNNILMVAGRAFSFDQNLFWHCRLDLNCWRLNFLRGAKAFGGIFGPVFQECGISDGLAPYAGWAVIRGQFLTSIDGHVFGRIV